MRLLVILLLFASCADQVASHQLSGSWLELKDCGNNKIVRFVRDKK